MVDVDRLASTMLPPLPPLPTYSSYFLVIRVGMTKGNLMDQPSVSDTILKLYEMSPKINYFDLASQCQCCLFLSKCTNHIHRNPFRPFDGPSQACN